jgi:hypothetical protein
MNFYLIFVQPMKYMNPISNYILYSVLLEILVCVCVCVEGDVILLSFIYFYDFWNIYAKHSNGSGKGHM